MSTTVNIKEASRTDWCVKPLNNGNYPGDTNIQLGCLMRIADATEAMAKNHNALINDLDWYKKRYMEHVEEIERLKKRIAAMKGVITRMKNKSNKL